MANIPILASVRFSDNEKETQLLKYLSIPYIYKNTYHRDNNIGLALSIRWLGLYVGAPLEAPKSYPYKQLLIQGHFWRSTFEITIYFLKRGFLDHQTHMDKLWKQREEDIKNGR